MLWKIRTSQPRWNLGLAALLALAGLAAVLVACSDGESNSSSTTTATTAPPTSTTSAIITAPPTTIDLHPSIELERVGSLVLDETLDLPDYVLRGDTFDRCSLYTDEILNNLLNRRFELTFTGAGISDNRGGCLWMGAHDASGATFALLVKLVRLTDEVLAEEEPVDPTLGDFLGVVGDRFRNYPWAEIVWELTSSSFGSGFSFRSYEYAGQVIIFSETDLGIDKSQAELILAQNLGTRILRQTGQFNPLEQQG